MCDGTSQYAVVEFSGKVLVPDAGTCYEAACEISRRTPALRITAPGKENAR